MVLKILSSISRCYSWIVDMTTAQFHTYCSSCTFVNCMFLYQSRTQHSKHIKTSVENTFFFYLHSMKRMRDERKVMQSRITLITYNSMLSHKRLRMQAAYNFRGTSSKIFLLILKTKTSSGFSSLHCLGMWESCQWLGVRRWFSPGFLHYLQLASHELATIGIKRLKTKYQIPNFPSLWSTTSFPVFPAKQFN